ncbi:MAG: hypothetical protein ABH821_03595 [archaeon]
MVSTVALQDVLRPGKSFVEPSVQKVISRQVILIAKENVTLKIELENHLRKDFSDLPLFFDNLLPKFRVVSHQSLIPVENFVKVFDFISSVSSLEKHFSKVEKELFKERLKEKISLQKYLFSKVYLSKIRELAELLAVVLSVPSKKSDDFFSRLSVFFMDFKPKIEDYSLRLLTFFSLLHLLQKKNLVFKEDIFNKVNLYSLDLSKAHAQLVSQVKEEFE